MAAVEEVFGWEVKQAVEGVSDDIAMCERVGR